jgi:hypothetical protein
MAADDKEGWIKKKQGQGILGVSMWQDRYLVGKQAGVYVVSFNVRPH